MKIGFGRACHFLRSVVLVHSQCVQIAISCWRIISAACMFRLLLLHLIYSLLSNLVCFFHPTEFSSVSVLSQKFEGSRAGVYEYSTVLQCNYALTGIIITIRAHLLKYFMLVYPVAIGKKLRWRKKSQSRHTKSSSESRKSAFRSTYRWITWCAVAMTCCNVIGCKNNPGHCACACARCGAVF